MYYNDSLSMNKTNRHGVPYGKIQAAIVKTGFDLLRKGVAFDYVNEHPDVENWGYKRLVRVSTTGTVEEQ